MIFARIGHGPCYYYWNEIFAGVYKFACFLEISSGEMSRPYRALLFLTKPASRFRSLFHSSYCLQAVTYINLKS